ncbi:MAG: hypothetical protein WC612_06575 [Bdellovibrionales bacterium]
MVGRNILKVILFIGIFVCTAPLAAQASNVSELEVITNAADKICGIVPTVGKNANIDAKANIKAELSKLAKKLADMGTSVSAGYADTTYEGLAQKDLPAALKNNSDCKIKVVEVLKGSVSANSVPTGSTAIYIGPGSQNITTDSNNISGYKNGIVDHGKNNKHFNNDIHR